VPAVLLAAAAILGGLFPGPVVEWVSHELSALLGGLG